MKFRLRSAISAILLAATLSASGGDGVNTPLKVLAIGNSFSRSAYSHLPSIASNLDKKLDFMNLYYGGCTLQQHWDNHATTGFYQGIDRSFRTSPNNVSAFTTSTVSLDAALEAEAWDIVTLQQGSAKSYTLSNYEPYFGNLVALIHAKAPTATIWIHQTWSYGESKAASAGHTSDTMYDAICANYNTMASNYSIPNQIPVGYAVQAYRHLYDATSILDSSGWHLSSPSGEYMQGCVWAAELFHVDPETITYRPSAIDTDTAANLRHAAKLAHDASDLSDYSSLSPEQGDTDDPINVPNNPVSSTSNATGVQDGNDAIYTFTQSGSFTIGQEGKLQVLVVGGGGGGGGLGGGGGGGVAYWDEMDFPVGTYAVTVGNGGTKAGTCFDRGTTGGSSSVAQTTGSGFTTLTVLGGGGGAGWNYDALSGANGGGGSPTTSDNLEINDPTTVTSGRFLGATGTAATGQSGTGHKGGNATGYKSSAIGSGGGAGGAGAGADGGHSQVYHVTAHNDTTIESAGAGGDGLACSITGSEVYYGGGGGGGARRSNFKYGGAGGLGGGGRGCGAEPGNEGPAGNQVAPTSFLSSQPGVDGLGGGGGSGAWGANGGSVGFPASNGGSGVVILRYHYVSEPNPTVIWTGTDEYHDQKRITYEITKLGESNTAVRLEYRYGTTSGSLGEYVTALASSGLATGAIALPSANRTDTYYGQLRAVGLDTATVCETEEFEFSFRLSADVGAVTSGVKTQIPGHDIYTFGSSGTITLDTEAKANVLVVGGGGGGGGLGGGGGGGVGYWEEMSIPAGTYAITVGAGGAKAGDCFKAGTNGGSSSIVQSSGSGFSTITVLGGGGGGGWDNDAKTGANGGGGSSGNVNPAVSNPTNVTSGRLLGAAGTAAAGQIGTGHKGGNATGYNQSTTGSGGGAGGGGAGADGNHSQVFHVGSNNETTIESAGAGGDGLPCSITGTEVYYGGGGGGGARRSNFKHGGAGGLGGGGRGCGAEPGREGPSGNQAAPTSFLPSTAGTDGLGGGGGSGAWAANGGNGYPASNGGSGVVIFSFTTGRVPEVAFSGYISSEVEATTEITYDIVRCGDLDSAVSVEFQYGFTEDSLGAYDAIEASKTAGIYSFSISGLEVARTYYGRIRVTGLTSGTTDESEIFEFVSSSYVPAGTVAINEQASTVDVNQNCVLTISGELFAAGEDPTECTVTLSYWEPGDEANPSSESLVLDPDTLEYSGSVALDPATTYNLSLIAVNGNSQATLILDPVTTLGAYAVNSALTLSADQRLVTATCTVSAIGAGELTIELWGGASSSNLTKLDERTVTAAGNHAFTWDASEVVAFNAKAYAQVRYASACNGSAVADGSTSTANITLLDKAGYSWTGEGTDSNWTTDDNWTADKTDAIGHPTSAENAVTVGIDADVSLDLSLTIKTLSLGTGKDITLRGTNTLTISSNMSTLTLGANTHFTLTDAVILTMPTPSGKNVSMTNDGTVFTVSNGAKFWYPVTSSNTGNSDFYVGGAGTKLVIDDATFVAPFRLHPNYNKSADACIVLKGKNPHLDLTSCLTLGTGSGEGRFVFEIPKGGYGCVPVDRATAIQYGNWNWLFPSGKNRGSDHPTTNLTFVVSSESPALVSSDCVPEQTLVSFNAGMNTNALRIAEMPSDRATVWFDDYTNLTTALSNPDTMVSTGKVPSVLPISLKVAIEPMRQTVLIVF